MYLGEIHYGVWLITSVIASALSFLWYSPYVFGKKDARVTFALTFVRFVFILICTITVSALLNSLLITDVVQLVLFALWISFGLCVVFMIPVSMQCMVEKSISHRLIDIGHAIFVVFLISSLLFLLQ